MLLVVIIKVLRCDEHRLLPSPHLVPSQFPVRNAVESGEDIHSDTRGQDRGRVSAGDIEWERDGPILRGLMLYNASALLQHSQIQSEAEITVCASQELIRLKSFVKICFISH